MKSMREPNSPTCTYALNVEDKCQCYDCVRRRALNQSAADDIARSQSRSMADQIKDQQKTHEDQFDIATAAAIQRGFGRWFDDTWMSARANGALPNPFISSIFVFITTVLMRKFVGGFAKDMPMDHKERAIADAKQMMIGYLDQIEAAAIKDLHAPKPEAPITSKGKQSIILPQKKVFRH